MAHFDRFDICEAYYLFATFWHGRAFAREYNIFGRLNKIQFRPRPSLRNDSDLSENAREIYNALVDKHSMF